MRHLLVTNDFPPKVGGIQTYLWELWRRLPPGEVTVLTTPHRDARAFDAAQPFRVERDRARWLLPTRALARRIDRLAAEVGAELVVLDPAVPLGLLGPRLERPYALVVHGAELAIPGRAPGVRRALRHVLRSAELVVAGGGYPGAEAARAAGAPVPTVLVPPGVDPERFHPLAPDERRRQRARLGLDPDALVVLGLSRLVPRKGFDVLVEAGAALAGRHPDLQVAIVGAGRDRRRLERLAEHHGSPVRFLGRLPEADIPVVHAVADCFAMLCRDRWAGLEQEGFGIVFLEASACGVPVVAGRSGGSHEAVADGTTGFVLGRRADVAETAAALDRLLSDPALRHRMGAAGRRRAAEEYDYDLLARRLAGALEQVGMET